MKQNHNKDHEIKTRFGMVNVSYGEWRGKYQSIFFEGHKDAVIWVVGQRLESTDTCYEHMFRVRNLELIDVPSVLYGRRIKKLKAECEWTSYCGD